MKRISGAIALIFVIALVAMSPTAAHADVSTIDSTNAPASISIAFAPSWVQLLQLVVTVLLPVAVGLVTTRETNAGRKALLLLGLAAITGLGTELLNAITTGETYDLATGLYTALRAFIVGVALHYGLLKPTGVSNALASTARKSAPEHRAE